MYDIFQEMVSDRAVVPDFKPIKFLLSTTAI